MADQWDGKPRRRRWPWVLGAILVVTFGPVLWYWGSTILVKRQLLRRIEQLRAAGEPMYAADLNPAPIPNSDNAAIDLWEAIRLVKAPDEWFELGQAEAQAVIPLAPKELARLQKILADNAEPLRLVEMASKKRGVDWQIRFKTPAINTLLPHLNGVRQLGRLVKMDGQAAHQKQDDRQALGDARRILFLSRATDQQPTFIVTHLVGLGISALGCDLIEQIAPDLRIGPTTGAADAQQVRALIGELLDDALLRQGQKDALRGERMQEIDTLLAIANGKLSLSNLTMATGGSDMPDWLRWPLSFRRQVLYSDARLMMEKMTQAIEATDQSATWPAFQQTGAGQRLVQRRADWWSHPYASFLMPSFDRAAQMNYRGLTDRRLAASALAIRWYAAEHDGRLPATLADLVPKYLPAVPADPMAKNALIQYRPDLMILYSVGEDGRDDGGSESPMRGVGQPTRPGRWQTLDAVWHLDRQERELPKEVDPATTQPAENGP